MSGKLQVRRPLELGYRRKALFALELLDAITLSRINDGIEVVANGLRGKALVNAGGLFVWLEEDLRNLRSISIEPGVLPYEARELRLDELTLPPVSPAMTSVPLAPRADYPFAPGVTGLRGTLLEDGLPAQAPVSNAEVWLSWLHDDGTHWQDAPTKTHTTTDGDFVAMLQLAPSDEPKLDEASLSVRLNVRRGADLRWSRDLKLPQGRITAPSISKPSTFIWDELLF